MPFDSKEAAKEIVDAVMDTRREQDPRDVLTRWERDFFGAASVQLRIPLRDPVEVQTHLKLTIETLMSLQRHLQHSPSDRHALKTVEGDVKALNRKLNAYRRPRG